MLHTYVKLAIAGVLCCLLSYGCTASGAGASFDWFVYESHFERDRDPSTHIVIADIDDESLARLGTWPLDRGSYATAAINAFTAGAAIVAIDVMFREPGSAVGDSALAQLARKNKQLVFAYQGLDGSIEHFYPELAAAQPSAGSIDIFGGARRDVVTMMAIPPEKGTSLPQAVSQLYCHSGHSPCQAIRISETDLVYRKRERPLWGINFQFPASKFERIPFFKLVSGETGKLDGAIVVISPSSQSLYDQYWVPQGFERWRLPGSIALGYSIDTAISGTSIAVLPLEVLLLTFSVLNALVLIFVIPLRGWLHYMLPVYLVLLGAIHWLAFEFAYLHLPASFCLANVICMWIAGGYIQLLFERHK